MTLATKTAYTGLYRWLATDDIQTSISQVSGNFDELEAKFKQEAVNIKSFGFGAKGDGTTNDAGALQKALDIAKASTASVIIFIPEGTYRMTAELKVYSNTKISMSPNTKLVRAHSGYLFMNGNRSSEAEPTTSTGYNGRGNIQFIGGTLDGNGANQPQKASIIHFGHGDTITFNGVTFKDVYNSHHIEINACTNVTFGGCKFLGWFGGADDFNEAIQMDLSKAGVTTIGAADNTPCTNITVDNCYFGNSGTSGAKTIQRGIGSHSGTIGRWHSNVVINGNVFENCQSWAIRLYSTNNFSITNNNMLNCRLGLNVRTNIVGDLEDTKDANGNQTGASQDSQNGLISGNTFAGGLTAGRGIELYGEATGKIKGVVVSGNQINTPSASTDSICLHACDECTVTGNRVNGAGGAGITVKATCFNIAVMGNTVIDCQTYGISVADSNYVTIGTNVVMKSGNSGIYVAGGESTAIVGNSVAGANGKNGAAIDNNHIRVTTAGTKRVSITGNVCRNYSTTHTTTIAIYITNTVSDVVLAGNMTAGFSITNNAT